jgi:hypothetical protein
MTVYLFSEQMHEDCTYGMHIAVTIKQNIISLGLTAKRDILNYRTFALIDLSCDVEYSEAFCECKSVGFPIVCGSRHGTRFVLSSTYWSRGFVYLVRQ